MNYYSKQNSHLNQSRDMSFEKEKKEAMLVNDKTGKYNIKL